jgi:hypothetical protein
MAKTSVPEIKDESLPLAVIRIMACPRLRGAALKCVISIFRNFFTLQYRAALLPGLIPVNQVDHPLDEKIPFRPGHVAVYLDFVAFWIRCLGFLLRVYGDKAHEPVRDFIASMDGLYAFAAEVYKKNLSTTRRPFYLARPRFALIHAVDPHLMCVPSLHVMVVIRTYTAFRAMIAGLGGAETWAARTEEIYRGALAITEAVLYVKQHSVNCISAAMYAMSRFDGPEKNRDGLFPPAEAECFVSELFKTGLAPGEGENVRRYILDLYKRFLSRGEKAPSWKEPLLEFLRELPRK